LQGFNNGFLPIFRLSANVEAFFVPEQLTQGFSDDSTVIGNEYGIRHKQPPEPLAGCWPRRNVQADGRHEEGFLQPYTLRRRRNSARDPTTARILPYDAVPLNDASKALISKLKPGKE
jgi:hypothetical protein